MDDVQDKKVRAIVNGKNQVAVEQTLKAQSEQVHSLIEEVRRLGELVGGLQGRLVAVETRLNLLMARASGTGPST